MKISLEPPSSPTIPAGGQVTQQLVVPNNNRTQFFIKALIEFLGFFW